MRRYVGWAVLEAKIVALFILIGVELAVAGFFLAKDMEANRFGSQFINQLPIHSDSPYLRVWQGGIAAFQESPIIGIGPDVYRKTCPVLTEGLSDIDCHTHPHNFYIQLAGETGLVGLVAGCFMMGSILITCFSYRHVDKENIFTAVAYVIPLALFSSAIDGGFFGSGIINSCGLLLLLH